MAKISSRTAGSLTVGSLKARSLNAQKPNTPKSKAQTSKAPMATAAEDSRNANETGSVQTGSLAYQGPERRQHFRICQQAWIELTLVDEQAPRSAAEYFPPAPGFALLAELQTLDDEAEALLSRISEQDKHTAAYLRLLNRKIQTVVQHLSLADATQAPQAIDLSEAGIGFCTTQALAPGSIIALQLQLPPQNLGLWLLARVVYQQPWYRDAPGVAAKTAIYRTGCQFQGLSETEQLLLSRHILSIQAQERREQRQHTEREESRR